MKVDERRDAQWRQALLPFLQDVDEALEREIQARRPKPDLHDAVARARALDGKAVPAQWEQAASAVEMPREFGPDDMPAALASFLTDVRGHVDRVSEERGAEPLPPLRPRGRPWGRTVAVTAAVVGIAAALVLVLPGLLQGWSAARDRDSGTTIEEAPLLGENAVAEGVAQHRERPKNRTHEQVAPAPELPEDTIIIEDSDEEEVALPPRAPAKPARGALAVLDEEASVAWARGDRAAAEKKLEEIVRRGGRSARAELAFGDLFTIAYQSHGLGRRVQLWKRYLKKFPRGRYADDARAGLCRTAKGASGKACWGLYLEDWPKGSHRREANAAVESP